MITLFAHIETFGTTINKRFWNNPLLTLEVEATIPNVREFAIIPLLKMDGIYNILKFLRKKTTNSMGISEICQGFKKLFPRI